MTVKGVRIGLKNLWRWRKVVWRDRDWDWWFLLRVLQYKLGAMEEYFKQVKSVDATKIVGEIRDAKGAVDFILADGPAETAWDGWELYMDVDWVKRERNLGKPLPDEWYQRHETEARLETEAVAKLFDTLRDHAREWWD